MSCGSSQGNGKPKSTKRLKDLQMRPLVQGLTKLRYIVPCYEEELPKEDDDEVDDENDNNGGDSISEACPCDQESMQMPPPVPDQQLCACDQGSKQQMAMPPPPPAANKQQCSCEGQSNQGRQTAQCPPPSPPPPPPPPVNKQQCSCEGQSNQGRQTAPCPPPSPPPPPQLCGCEGESNQGKQMSPPDSQQSCGCKEDSKEQKSQSSADEQSCGCKEDSKEQKSQSSADEQCCGCTEDCEQLLRIPPADSDKLFCICGQPPQTSGGASDQNSCCEQKNEKKPQVESNNNKTNCCEQKIEKNPQKECSNNNQKLKSIKWREIDEDKKNVKKYVSRAGSPLRTLLKFSRTQIRENKIFLLNNLKHLEDERLNIPPEVIARVVEEQCRKKRSLTPSKVFKWLYGDEYSENVCMTVSRVIEYSRYIVPLSTGNNSGKISSVSYQETAMMDSPYAIQVQRRFRFG